MGISSSLSSLPNGPSLAAPEAPPKPLPVAGQPELREAFDSFVGQAFYGQMLSALRKTVGKPAYFDGGRGEELFRQQLDQVLAEKLATSSAAQISEPMFELFNLQRQ